MIKARDVAQAAGRSRTVVDIRCSHLAANQAQKPRLPKLPKLPVVVHFGRSVAAGRAVASCPPLERCGSLGCDALLPSARRQRRRQLLEMRLLAYCVTTDRRLVTLTTRTLKGPDKPDTGGRATAGRAGCPRHRRAPRTPRRTGPRSELAHPVDPPVEQLPLVDHLDDVLHDHREVAVHLHGPDHVVKVARVRSKPA